jgi:Cu/Ag efflux protein CusF
MRKLLASVIVVIAATFAHAQAPAGQGFVEMKASGVPGKATAKRVATATATVKAVDVAARTVTLQNAAGETATIKVGPEVKRLAEFAPGDTLQIDVAQDLVLEYQSAGTPAVQPAGVVAADRADAGQAPAGVVAAGVQATVTVTAIDAPNRFVVFQGPGGTLYQVKAGPKVKLEKLKVGDRLLATYIEAVAVRLEKPAKK